MTTPTAPPPQGPGNYGPPPSYQPPPPPPAAKKHRKWPWIVLAVVVVIGIIAAVNGGSKKDQPSAATQSAASSVASAIAASPAPASTPANEAPATTAPTAATSAPATTGAVVVGTPVPFIWSNYPTRSEGVATVNSAEWDTTPPQFGTLKNGAALILDVTIETTLGTVSVNPLYWQARDAEGRVYTYAFTSGKDPSLQSGDVPAGTKSRGYVAIDAPQGPMTVELQPVFGSPVATWSVPA